MRHGHGHEAQIGGHDPPQAVPEQDGTAGQPLGPGQQHIVRPCLLQNPVADHVGVVPQMAAHHHGHGQDQVDDPVRRAALPPDWVGPGAGQPPQGYGEHQNQYQGQPELRNTAGGGAHPANHPIHQRILTPGAQRPQQQGEDEQQRKAHAAQEQGVPGPAGNHLRSVHLVLKWDAQLPPGGVGQPPDILDMDRVVEPQLLLRQEPLLRAHLLHPVPVVGYQGVAGGQPGNIEHRHG